MKKALIKIILLSTVYCLLSTGVSSAQEEIGFIKSIWRRIIGRGKVEEKVEEEKAPQSPEKKPTLIQPKKLTKGEKLAIIEDHLSLYGDEISSRIPNLITETDEKGNVFYKFKKETGEIIGLEELDEETLSALYGRITNEATLIRSENLQRQLAVIRQQPVPPPRTYQPPHTVVHPPRIPEVPKAPPTPPKVPPPPPSPQRK